MSVSFVGHLYGDCHRNFRFGSVIRNITSMGLTVSLKVYFL